MKVRFDNSYARLSDKFYTRVDPEPVPDPQVVRVNRELAERLGFDVEWLESEEGAKFATGNELLEGSQPIATVYAGHQFGNWVPRLGDGRALLLGEVVDEDGRRFDIQLKGSGRTPYSRRGDGRSPLGPVLREYIVSEAMHALGVPTTRSLVAASTGAEVRREEHLPGGVLVRVARSHIRIGTFEYFSGQRDSEGISELLGYVIARHYPELEPDDVLGLLRAVSERQAALVAQWMLVGFIHGVMNTDNMLLSGETIDYGPCAFMNIYDPGTVYSSIDRMGRYAYGNQPPIAQWNMSRLAESLLRVLDVNDELITEAQGIIDDFPDKFRAEYGAGMARKLGLSSFDEDDWPLIEDLLGLMHDTRSDYTLTFRRLTELAGGEDCGPSTEFYEMSAEFEPWLATWRERLGTQDESTDEIVERMKAVNPVVIPRNHLVENALEAAVQHEDFEPFHDLVDTLARPFEIPADSNYMRPPKPEERVVATFCGT